MSTMSTGKKRKLEEKLHCFCKKPNDPAKPMVQCEFCDEWFHLGCIGMEEEEIRNCSHWFCRGCIELKQQDPLNAIKGSSGFQGRCAPKEGWNDMFEMEELDEKVIESRLVSSRNRIEGYNLFKEGKVLSISSNRVGDFFYFRGQCQPAMKQIIYIVYCSFKRSGKCLKWATCSCPAGIDGKLDIRSSKSIEAQTRLQSASPDRLVSVNNVLKLVEIKCPYSLFRKQKTIREQTGDNFYLEFLNDTYVLKRQHDYFYQIQGQLNISGISSCDFVVFVPPDDIVIINVKKDTVFFETEMLPKLSEIWFNNLLPSFTDSL